MLKVSLRYNQRNRRDPVVNTRTSRQCSGHMVWEYGTQDASGSSPKHTAQAWLAAPQHGNVSFTVSECTWHPSSGRGQWLSGQQDGSPEGPIVQSMGIPSG